MSLALALVLFLLPPGDTRHRATVIAFETLTGYPHGRPGFVVDHQIPLCAGGPDAVSNMAWQEAKASYVKDVFERALCVAMHQEGYVLVKAPPPPVSAPAVRRP